MDNCNYPVTIDTFDANGRLSINYDNGDIDLVYMANKRWRFSASTANSLSAVIPEVSITQPTVIGKSLDYYRNKPIIRHQAQRFSSYPLLNAYKTEKKALKESVKIVAKCDVPLDAYIISYHTL